MRALSCSEPAGTVQGDAATRPRHRRHAATRVHTTTNIPSSSAAPPPGCLPPPARPTSTWWHCGPVVSCFVAATPPRPRHTVPQLLPRAGARSPRRRRGPRCGYDVRRDRRCAAAMASGSTALRHRPRVPRVLRRRTARAWSLSATSPALHVTARPAAMSSDCCSSVASLRLTWRTHAPRTWPALAPRCPGGGEPPAVGDGPATRRCPPAQLPRTQHAVHAAPQQPSTAPAR